MARWNDVNGIYQIYPRSFKDSNGDGVGDLAGIAEKLDYVKGGDISLGIDAIWISPFYRSPMADFGYDVSDYYAIDPLFGTLDDFKHLLSEAHARDIKVMVDYVPNHTSEEHPWFQESRSSKNSDKRDWYVWRDAKPDGSPPNNWLSVFGGSVWEWDEPTGQYYLHSFLREQPDLNWDNPEVRKAMTDVLRFWLDMGVDGIRADAVRWLSKDPEFQDNLPNPQYMEGEDDPFKAQLNHHNRYGKNLFAYLKEISRTIEEYPDRIILFEDYPDQHMDVSEQYSAFYAVDPDVAAPFNFEGMKTPYGAHNFQLFIDQFQKVLGSELRPFYCFSNHDKSRLASRVGERQARLIGLMQLTLPGIPVVYYGDELGMHDVPIPSDKVQDPFEKQSGNMGLGRDPERTPMQWVDDPKAGFTTGVPWLPVAADIRDRNVVTEIHDSSSFLSMYKMLLEMRRSNVFKLGSYEEWPGSNDRTFGYYRRYKDETILILLNMSDEKVECDNAKGAILVSTHTFVESGVNETLTLEPHQGIVLRCS